MTNSFKYLKDDEIPVLRNVDISEFKKKFKIEVELFLKDLSKVKKNLIKPIHALIKYITEMYEEEFNRLFKRIILISTANDDYVQACFVNCILIQKVLINIRNIFISYLVFHLCLILILINFQLSDLIQYSIHNFLSQS